MQSTLTELQKIKDVLSKIFPGDKTGIIYKFNLVTGQSTPTELIYNIERHLEQPICKIDTIGSVSVSTIDGTEYRKILHISPPSWGCSVPYPPDAQHIIVKSSFKDLMLDGKSDKAVKALQQQRMRDVDFVERIINCDILGCNLKDKVYSSGSRITTIKYDRKWNDGLVEHHDIVAFSHSTERLEKELQEEGVNFREMIMKETSQTIRI